MSARIVSLDRLSAGDIARWADLRNRAIDPYPFLDPRMVITSLPHMPLAREMKVILVEDGSTLQALMPFTVTRRRDRPHLRIVATRTEFLDDQGGWDHPLVDEANSVDVIEELLGAMKSLRLPRVMEWTSLPVGGALYTALGAVARRKRLPLVELARTEFVYANRSDREVDDGGPAPVFSLPHLSPRMRKDLERKSSALARTAGTELRIVDRSHDPSAVEEFLDLESRGWKGNQARGGEGIGVRDNAQWFREVTARYRADGDLLVFALMAGSRAVHMRVSTRVGDDVFGWFDAYDEDYADFRPGVLGRVASMNRILRIPGVRSFDPNFHPTTGEAKKLFPERRARATVLVATGGVSARVAVSSLPMVRRVIRFSKALLRRSG